jgi:hypothetical protein
MATPKGKGSSSALQALAALAQGLPEQGGSTPGVRQPELNRDLSSPDIPASTRALQELLRQKGRVY